MIGYYAHHVGSGHVHRALAVAAELGGHVTGLSSAAAPAGWAGAWVRLPRDDASREAVDAGGRLHWAPRHDPGLRRRMAEISRWIDEARPDALVVDVSVEVTLLARLHGVPVVTVLLPGDRGDAAHLLGLDVAEAVVAAWPAEARGMVRGLPADVAARVEPVGAISRLPVRQRATPSTPDGAAVPHAVLMAGDGGTSWTAARVAEATASAPHWRWTVLSRSLGTWVPDPAPVLASADVVVTHAGQNAVAEVAALRVPAVVVPEDRPHAEQHTSAAALDAGPWPVIRRDHDDVTPWSWTLAAARRLDGRLWSTWCDGRGAARLAATVRRAAATRASGLAS